MTNRSKSRGTAAEREVVRYLQSWWPEAERRALAGNKDKGDVAGIPGVVVEVKAAETQHLAAWKKETLTERENAGASACVLVVKRPYKPVGQWDAYLPNEQVHCSLEGGEWSRMDLGLAVALLRSPSPQSLNITA